MHKLLLTLGKAHPKDGGRYRTVQYRFDDGTVSEPTPFFGLALWRHLVHTGNAPNELLLAGTATSMWDAWLECNDVPLDDYEDFYLKLGASATTSGVTGEQLQDLERILSTQWHIPVHCILLPMGTTGKEQSAILHAIADNVAPGDSITLDVTHGFRTLPMLEWTSSLLIANAQDVSTDDIFYGALDMAQDGIAPAIRMRGLLCLQRWIEAVSILRKTGNLIGLASLPELEPIRNALNNCQFCLQMNNLEKAKTWAENIWKWFNAQNPAEDAPLSIFRNPLMGIFSWYKGNNFARQQWIQAKETFRHGEYLRSVILLQESLISLEVGDEKLMADFQERDNAAALWNLRRKKRKNGARTISDPDGMHWGELHELRNALAHGTVSKHPKIIKCCSDWDAFRAKMEMLLDWADQQISSARSPSQASSIIADLLADVPQTPAT